MRPLRRQPIFFVGDTVVVRAEWLQDNGFVHHDRPGVEHIAKRIVTVTHVNDEMIKVDQLRGWIHRNWFRRVKLN